MKRHANFFKHGNNDGDVTIDFIQVISDMFIFFSILGINLCGEQLNDEESAFNMWFCVQKPNIMRDQGRARLVQLIPVDQLRQIQTLI